MYINWCMDLLTLLRPTYSTRLNFARVVLFARVVYWEITMVILSLITHKGRKFLHDGVLALSNWAWILSVILWTLFLCYSHLHILVFVLVLVSSMLSTVTNQIQLSTLPPSSASIYPFWECVTQMKYITYGQRTTQPEVRSWVHDAHIEHDDAQRLFAQYGVTPQASPTMQTDTSCILNDMFQGKPVFSEHLSVQKILLSILLVKAERNIILWCGGLVILYLSN